MDRLSFTPVSFLQHDCMGLVGWVSAFDWTGSSVYKCVDWIDYHGLINFFYWTGSYNSIGSYDLNCFHEWTGSSCPVLSRYD